MDKFFEEFDRYISTNMAWGGDEIKFTMKKEAPYTFMGPSETSDLDEPVDMANNVQPLIFKTKLKKIKSQGVGIQGSLQIYIWDNLAEILRHDEG